MPKQNGDDLCLLKKRCCLLDRGRFKGLIAVLFEETADDVAELRLGIENEHIRPRVGRQTVHLAGGL